MTAELELVCIDCDTPKPRSEYYTHTKSGKPYRHCKKCHTKRATKNRTPEQSWRRHLKWRFKMTPEQYEEKLQAQEYRCTICHKMFTNDARIDHDHSCCPDRETCGKCLRDIICQRCNAFVGYVETTPNLVDEVLAYIERHK